MSEDGLTKEQTHMLNILRQNGELYLREIHKELAVKEGSRCSYSPNIGEGWNDERHEVKDVRDELDAMGLLQNDYQLWSLSKEGRERVEYHYG